jgi:LuxR family maltose regulon positive regulatory protein
MVVRLSYREMAEQLFLSINTIKWYSRSTYSKLGASSKVEAAERARELSTI